MANANRRGFRAAWVLVLLLAGCRPAQTVSSLTGSAMGTSYSIKYVPRGSKDLVWPLIDAELDIFNTVFSTYDPDSEISRFNKHGSTDAFVATERFAKVVRRALKLAEQTAGAYDPTVGPVLRLYGFGPGAKAPKAAPSQAALEAARARCGWRRIKLQNGTLTKEIPELELDLNSIAKGTGVDVVAGILDGQGITSYLVEIGGEVRCRGEKPGGIPWRLGVAAPLEVGSVVDFAAKVDLRDQAMATSGSYLQYRQIAADRVHHIIDPRTGRNPGIRVVSVTVVAPTCERADGLATALMVLGPDEGNKVLTRLPDADVLRVLYQLIDESGKVVERGHRW